MQVEVVVVGRLEENCYIISNQEKCLIVDPGDEIEKIQKQISGRKVLAVLLTHHHPDHIGALPFFVKENISVYEHKMLEEKEYVVGPFVFEVIFTPGHTKDSVSYYFKEDKRMFTGDFLFLESIGRTEFQGGSIIEMQESLKRINQYSSDIVVYPGHDESTTLEHEKKYNPYLNNNF